MLTTETNFFGDFDFEGLADDTVNIVIIEAKDYKPRELTANSTHDVCLNIVLW